MQKKCYNNQIKGSKEFLYQLIAIAVQVLNAVAFRGSSGDFVADAD